MDNRTWLWRSLVGVGFTVVLGLSGWTLSAVANMPKEYTLKNDFQQLREENREDHQAIMREIRKLIGGKYASKSRESIEETSEGEGT